MSNSPTDPTSTTASSTSWRSETSGLDGRLAGRGFDTRPPGAAQPTDEQATATTPLTDEQATATTPPTDEQATATTPPTDQKVGLIACGAIAQPAAEIVARRGWAIDVHPLPPLLHNRPGEIALAVRDLAERLALTYAQVVVGYADCGTYGALDSVCADLGLPRLPGLHCYDVYAGARQIEALMDEQPGTYLLTDFLVKSFARTVEQELGLDRYPELLPEYFRHYTRVVWLAQQPTAELQALATAAAERLDLPLEIRPTGVSGLEQSLADLLR